MSLETLAFPGRRGDAEQIELALGDLLARAGTGLVRGNTLAASTVLGDALELLDAIDEDGTGEGWSLVVADGVPEEAGQLVALLVSGSAVELLFGRGPVPALRAFCEEKLERAAIEGELARRLSLFETKLTTTARVLALWRSFGGSEPD